MKQIEDMGVKIAHVTLHVGLGTFRPVKVENVLDHHMHSEFYVVDEAEAKKVNEVTRGEREQLVKGMKEFPLTINGLRDIQEAIITRGGVTVKEVDPSTMESKIVKNLYLAGEMLDLDALTGGYNLQIAWSTGYLAGQ